MIWRHVGWLCIAMVMAVSGGCATYVNIPKQPGDVAQHNINNDNVRSVCIEAIRGMLSGNPITGRYIIVLPQGASVLTYQIIIANLDEWATAELDQPAPIIELRQIRIRGNKASVDLIRPANALDMASPGQLVTVDLKWEPLSGWGATHLHAWRAPLNRTMPLDSGTSQTPVGP